MVATLFLIQQNILATAYKIMVATLFLIQQNNLLPA